MEFRFTIYSGLFLATTIVSFFVAVLAWRRRNVKGAKDLVHLMTSAGYWTFWILLESMAVTKEMKVLFSQIAYVGAVFTPVLYFSFVLRYVGKEKYLAPKANKIFLTIVPVITLILTFTNNYHHQLWSGYSAISPETNLMEYGHGIAFWIGYMSYNYLLLAIVTLNLYDFILHRSLYYRKQGIIIVIAGFSPWTASILYLSGANPVAGLDLVPISMIISGSLFAYSIFYYRFLDLVPVARKTLVETLPDGILAIDEFDRIQEINHAAINFLGIKQKDILGRSLDACGAEVKPLFQALTNTQTNEQISLEETGKTYSVLHQPIHNQPGSRLVIIRDITEQIESVRKIREGDVKYRNLSRMFRLMADNMPDLIWAKNLNKEYIFTNKAMCNVLLQAVDTEEPVGKTDMYFAQRERDRHPENPDWHTFGELCQGTDDTVIGSGIQQQFDEYGNVRGKFLFFDVNKAPIIDESGTMIGVVGSARDITRQKENETEIQRKDQLLNAITQATALLIQGEIYEESIVGALEIIGKATSADRAYIFKNNPHPLYKLPVLSMLFEWTNGKFSSQINNPEMQSLPFDELGESWYDILSSGSVINGLIKDLPDELRNIFEAQEVKSALIAPVFINATFWGIVGFDDCSVGRLWSITEENLLSAAANTIGAAYQRRLHREELIAAKDKAEESDRLKSAFLANMSHEIRTPMNGILGFAELLKEPGLSGEEQNQYISIIEKSGVRMLNIINDIVDISKIESGQMEIYLKETDINTQIQYIHSFFTPETEAKKINFNYHNTLFNNESIITTDREKLYAILTNLVKNAIKYTREGSIDFGYKRNDTMLEFYVSDTGIGVPKNRQEAIFERFVQADIADKKAMQGAGLGLSITKAYVEMLGGKIWLESEEGKGSVFYFTIPYTPVIIQPEIPENDTSERSENSVNQLKILIAEDEVTSDLFITLSIKSLCREILHASNGFDVIKLCREHPDIDVILMDIKMPEMNGYEATRQIRTFNKEVIIIAQTAFGLITDQAMAIEAGCNDYISKPVRVHELKAIINKQTSKKTDFDTLNEN